VLSAPHATFSAINAVATEKASHLAETPRWKIFNHAYPQQCYRSLYHAAQLRIGLCRFLIQSGERGRRLRRVQDKGYSRVLAGDATMAADRGFAARGSQH
jgi:hypothetical protein